MVLLAQRWRAARDVLGTAPDTCDGQRAELGQCVPAAGGGAANESIGAHSAVAYAGGAHDHAHIATTDIRDPRAAGRARRRTADAFHGGRVAFALAAR